MRACGCDRRGLAIEVFAKRGGRALEEKRTCRTDGGGRCYRESVCDVVRRLAEHTIVDDARDETDALGLLCPHPLIGQDHLLGAAKADHAGQEPTHAPIRCQADAGIGGGEMRRTPGDHDIAEQSQAQPRPCRRTVDHHDQGLGHRGKCHHGTVKRIGQGSQKAGCLITGSGHSAYVATGREETSGSRQDDAPHRWVRRDPRRRPGEIGCKSGVDGVARVGTVQRDTGDRALDIKSDSDHRQASVTCRVKRARH
ncbi:hypothetical protein WR25_02693 [Diploscapter pachys]|uniref:Uncharacterized protein n=1 Tax=Diploscapter pachys TaxID=2018661 RepID=A0A2A2K1R0_9BILA|nr:hypothetical protein WR25_02693 [Diploscapter pachys]